MSEHNFIESRANGSDYDVVIFCTKCGKVVWHFNKLEWSKEHLQRDIKEPCIDSKERVEVRGE